MNPDDPKFTAHALGEVEDLTPSERAEIEALLASDPSARVEAEEMRTLAARLRAELPGEEAEALNADQRAAVFSAAAGRASGPETAGKVVRFPYFSLVLAAAASIAVCASAFWFTQKLQSPASRTVASGTHEGSLSEVSALPAEQPAAPAPVVVMAPTPRATPAPVTAKDVDAVLLSVVTEQQMLKDQGRDAQKPVQQSSGSVAANSAPALSAEPAPDDLSISNPEGEKIASLKSDLANAQTELAKMQSAMTAPRPAAAPVRPVAVPAMPAAAPVGGSGQLAAKKKELSAYASSNMAGQTRSAGAVPEEALSSLAVDSPTPHTSRTTIITGAVRDTEREIYRRNEVGDDRRAYDFAKSKAVRDPQTEESYDVVTDNAFLPARENPLSTFSIDVDTASYSIVRRFLNNQQQPPKNAVRIEELLNYFSYDYELPQGDVPFSAAMEVAACPWAPEHRLVRIGLKGREIAVDKRPASNLVFLIDVSGSMQPENKLPLLKRSLGLLIDQLGPEDRVSIAVYAGSSGCVLEPTSDKRRMRAALNDLEAGGSTNGGSGVQLAYKLAEKSFIKGGTNRVILATDGDWNVGITDQNELVNLIKRKAKSGVFLTVLGVGMDNLKDSTLVKLADSGNGNYAYLDTVLEAKKVLVEQLSGTLITIAKDVKIQVEFNPAQVSGYRLIGYEKRLLAKQDFNDDKKDAGEIGASHTVTALYEVVPAGQPLLAMQRSVDPLKYQDEGGARKAQGNDAFKDMDAVEKKKQAVPEDKKGSSVEAQTAPAAKPDALGKRPDEVRNEMLTLKLRYKEPEGEDSKLLEFPLTDRGNGWEKSSRDFRFAAAVAGYGMLLRDSPYKGETSWSAVAEWAQEGKGPDASGYRAEFLGLIEKARALDR